MGHNLFPVFDVPATLANRAPNANRYPIAPLWDFEKGDFTTNEAQQVLYGTGHDAWVLWCVKTILTQRLAHYAYSGNAGIEADEAFKEPDRRAQESALQRTVTEALLADPKGRTRQARDFNFSWGVDSLNMSCVVIGANGNSATINASLSI